MGWDISVPLGSRTYRVVITGTDSWGTLPLPELRWRRAALVTDDRVGPLWSQPVLAWLVERGIEVSDVRIPAGEGSKDLKQTTDLYRSFVDSGIRRGDCVIALGGGVVGDLAGFAAATYLRGIDFVQIPTSLLAMVDSSVGGKVGINFDGIKNLVGSFHQPKLVLTSPEFLRTLEERHLANGMAEAIKAALVGDSDLFMLLEKDVSAIWRREEGCLGEIIARSVSVKARIVAKDEREEEGSRMTLNLGHTLGHALESATGYALLHGEAVGIGIVAACQLSVLLGIAPADHRRRVEAVLREHRLPTSARGMNWDALVPFLKKDKKLRGDGWTFVLTGGVGDVRVLQRVPEASVREAVAYVLE
jgi:3-dehydroquinate synthase